MTMLHPYMIHPPEDFEAEATETVVRAIRAMKPGDTVTLERHDPKTHPSYHVWTAQVPMPRHLNPSRVLKEDAMPTPPTVTHKPDGRTEIHIKPDRPFGDYIISLEPDEREQLISDLQTPSAIAGGFSVGDIVVSPLGYAYEVVPNNTPVSKTRQGPVDWSRHFVVRALRGSGKTPGMANYRLAENFKKVGHVTADVR